jgi:hypothetical protein
MSQTMRRIILFAATAALLALGACLFDTRDAQPPGNASGGCVLDSPQKAFVCMANALSAKQDGDYERSLSEDFFFSPTTADSLDLAFTGQCPYAGWTKQVEIDVLQLLLSDGEQITWDYGTPSPIINKNTFVRFEVNYRLLVRFAATPTDTTIFSAKAWIDVENESGNWRVTSWREQQTVPGFSTWGYKRGIDRVQQGTAACTP